MSQNKKQISALLSFLIITFLERKKERKHMHLPHNHKYLFYYRTLWWSHTLSKSTLLGFIILQLFHLIKTNCFQLWNVWVYRFSVRSIALRQTKTFMWAAKDSYGKFFFLSLEKSDSYKFYKILAKPRNFSYCWLWRRQPRKRNAYINWTRHGAQRKAQVSKNIPESGAKAAGTSECFSWQGIRAHIKISDY